MPISCQEISCRKNREVPRSGIELPAPSARATFFNVSDESRDALFRKAVTRAGIEDLTFHDSRHEAVTRLSKKLGILELARMIGHKDIRQLQVYYNETAAEIAKKL